MAIGSVKPTTGTSLSRDFCAESEEEESKEEIEVIKEPRISLQQEVEVS
ncbi:MAG TPA: hypothetical protein VK487_04255 [Candidatus Bathyarchaeia archaeon]|nr:hypothetical protein [Candidatus Bathyarchaeia archaeon]